MANTALTAVAAGLVSAVAALGAQLGLPGSFVLACFAPLPLLAAGLGRGLACGAIAAAAGVVAAVGLAGAAAAGVYAGLHALPSWLLVHAAVAWIGGNGAGRTPTPIAAGPTGHALGAATAAGAMLAMLAVYAASLGCAVAVAFSGPDGVEATMRTLLDQAVAVSMAALPVDARASFVDTAAPFFIGLFGISWQILIVGNALLAQRIVARRGWAIRPTPSWSALRLPEWLAWPLVAAAALSLVTAGDAQYLARSVALILATPYFFLGLVVVHTLARRSRAGGLLLTAFYISLVVFTVIAGAVVAGLGMIEQWAGVRSRMAPHAHKE
ncbi:MAG: DUF2232 domain-containing protein [Rhodospirillales bacterium]|nr:DUF2232 domain-containing protein [Rhodospirillales bacterium]